MARLITAAHFWICVCTSNAGAVVVTTFEYQEWQSWIGSYSTIDFTGFANGTSITNQYANHGVAFAGPVFIAGPTPGFPNDDWGLHGPSGVRVHFDELQTSIAIHHGNTAFFQLYSGGQLIGTSGFDPVGGIGSFLGVVSTVQFDEVFVTTQPIFGPHIFIDDLHWGAIPSPSVIGLLCVAGFRRRRRRGQLPNPGDSTLSR